LCRLHEWWCEAGDVWRNPRIVRCNDDGEGRNHSVYLCKTHGMCCEDDGVSIIVIWSCIVYLAVYLLKKSWCYYSTF
jgi:hypothetical protein